jgi:hypothetical protein
MSNNIYITYNIGTIGGWSVSGNSVNGGVLGTKNDDSFDIITNNTPRATISSDGEIGINKIPQSGVTLDVSGQVYAELFSNPQTITNNINIPNNTNSFAMGPVSLTGTVTVGVGSVLTII